MVKRYHQGRLINQPSLLASIRAEAVIKPVISVIGAGGKTTTIKRMAEEYQTRQIPVIVTTTTHMMAEDHPWLLLEPSLEHALEILKKEGMVWLGLPDKNGKMKAPPQELLGRVLELPYPIIIEADGARKLPLKAPAEHEPVLLGETTHVVNLYGLDAVGRSLNDICFRKELAAEILNRQTADMVRPQDIVKLALDTRGGRKDILPSMKYHVILNKADTMLREGNALNICRLAETQGFTELTVTGNSSAIPYPTSSISIH